MKRSNQTKFEIVEVTPAIALKWLESNSGNRPIRRTRVLTYAEQMRAGQWTLTGQPIIFDDTGRLATGQHRLHACVVADVSFTTAVVRGVDPQAVKNIDTGASWTFGDIAGTYGFSDPKSRTASARTYLMMSQQHTGDHLERWRGGGSSAGAIRPPSITDVLKVLEEKQSTLDRMLQIIHAKTARRILRPPASFGGLYLYLHDRNAKRCDEFFQRLADGESLERNNPIFRLRDALIQNLQVVGTRKKHTALWMISITLKAWNAWMRGEDVKVLRVSINEGWPKIESKKAGS